MAKKTTAAERKAFIEEQRAKPSGYGAKAVFPRDMSFIDKEGNIIRPTRDNPFPTVSGGYRGKSAGRKRYYDVNRAYETRGENNRYHTYHDLASEISPVIAIVGVLTGIFFLSTNITGNAIGNISNPTSSVIGACLIVIGLVAGFAYIKNRKK